MRALEGNQFTRGKISTSDIVFPSLHHFYHLRECSLNLANSGTAGSYFSLITYNTSLIFSAALHQCIFD